MSEPLWVPTPDSLEAIRFWTEQAQTWRGSKRDDRYVARALRTLAAMEAQVAAMSSGRTESVRSEPSTVGEGSLRTDAT